MHKLLTDKKTMKSRRTQFHQGFHIPDSALGNAYDFSRKLLRQPDRTVRVNRKVAQVP